MIEIDVHIHGERYFKTCMICGFYFQTKKSHLARRKTCGKECDAFRKKMMYKGKENPNYGNRGTLNPMFIRHSYISRLGYRMLYKPEHPNTTKTGHILEHRYVMSEYLGRPLKDCEHIHHIDENKLNNDITNLQVIDQASHSRLHALQRKHPRCEITGVFITKGSD